jgi:hypothetical protein
MPVHPPVTRLTACLAIVGAVDIVRGEDLFVRDATQAVPIWRRTCLLFYMSDKWASYPVDGTYSSCCANHGTSSILPSLGSLGAGNHERQLAGSLQEQNPCRHFCWWLHVLVLLPELLSCLQRSFKYRANSNNQLDESVFFYFYLSSKATSRMRRRRCALSGIRILGRNPF